MADSGYSGCRKKTWISEPVRVASWWHDYLSAPAPRRRGCSTNRRTLDCKFCGEEFETTDPRKMYCDVVCTMDAHRAKQSRSNQNG